MLKHDEAVTLLPCPFCGGRNARTVEGDDRWFVSCGDCYCCVGEALDSHAMPAHIFLAEPDAIIAWNTRPTLPTAGVEVTEGNIEIAARALCRLRIMSNMHLEGRPHDPSFMKRAENHGWENFTAEARAVIAALTPSKTE